MSISYDAVGNQLVNDKGSFTYNAANRMATHTGSQGQTRYVYDAQGQRTLKLKADGATHIYTYNQAGQLIQESRYSAAKALQQQLHYIWLGDKPVGLVIKDSSSDDWQIYAIHSDHLNTPRLMTDQDGAEVWRWASDAFGEGDAQGSITFNLRFPGQYYDAESGLHYNYFRDYNAATGRYVQSDPIGLAGGLNTYGYVSGNPLGFVDLLGLDDWSFSVHAYWGYGLGLDVGESLGQTYMRLSPGIGYAIGASWDFLGTGSNTAIATAQEETGQMCETAAGLRTQLEFNVGPIGGELTVFEAGIYNTYRNKDSGVYGALFTPSSPLAGATKIGAGAFLAIDINMVGPKTK